MPARVELPQWRLDIAGLVERPATLSYEDLRQLPEGRVKTFHQCADAPLRPDLPMRRIGVHRAVQRAATLRAPARTRDRP
jgi:DMSO/TMAO reductase YedYZ molybdopterin-dependent catalytic subunit